MSNIYKDIEKWIKRITTPINGYQICPYARKAKYKIYTHLDRVALLKYAIYWKGEYDLMICELADSSMTVEEASYIEYECNLFAKDTITLLDHPDKPGYIDGNYTGNGKRILFLIQSKEDLQKARTHLKTSTYYNLWTNTYYKDILREEKKNENS